MNDNELAKAEEEARHNLTLLAAQYNDIYGGSRVGGVAVLAIGASVQERPKDGHIPAGTPRQDIGVAILPKSGGTNTLLNQMQGKLSGRRFVEFKDTESYNEHHDAIVNNRKRRTPDSATEQNLRANMPVVPASPGAS
jgi:hypothetical protein